MCSPQRFPAGSFRGRHTGSATRCAGRAAARSAYQSAGASSGDWWVQTQQQSIESMQGSPQASSGHGSDPLYENVHHQMASSVHEHERLAPANRHAVHLVPLHSATGTGTATRSSPEANVYGSGGDARTSTARDDTCVVHVSAPDAVAPQHHAAEPRPVPSPDRSLSDGSLRAGIDLVQPHCSRSFMPHLDSSDRTLQVRLPAAQVAVLLSDAPQVIDPLPGLGASDGGGVEPIDDTSDLGDAAVRRLYTGLMHSPVHPTPAAGPQAQPSGVPLATSRLWRLLSGLVVSVHPDHYGRARHDSVTSECRVLSLQRTTTVVDGTASQKMRKATR